MGVFLIKFSNFNETLITLINKFQMFEMMQKRKFPGLVKV